MDNDLQKLEADLAALKPARLNEELLERLCVAAGDEPAAIDDSLRALEASLGSLQPAGLSDELTERLMLEVGRVPFP